MCALRASWPLVSQLILLVTHLHKGLEVPCTWPDADGHAKIQSHHLISFLAEGPPLAQGQGSRSGAECSQQRCMAFVWDHTDQRPSLAHLDLHLLLRGLSLLGSLFAQP